MLELIGLGEDLVERTCARIIEHRDRSDLSCVAVVFPSKRFGFFLRQELAARMEGNFFPPALFPIEAFFESLFKLNFPGCRILNDLEAAHAVYESSGAVFGEKIYGSRSVSDFAAFLPWAQKLLSALEEILTEGGKITGIDFEQYREFTGLGDYHRSYKDFISRIPELLADLETRLDGRRQATRGMACRRVAGLAESGTLEIPQARHWLFCAFNAMNACERKLYRFLDNHAGACFILRTDPKGLRDPHSPFHLQAGTIQELGLVLPAALPVCGAWDDLNEKVTIQSCDGVESEAYNAFRRLEEACRGRDEASLRKIAVLLPSASSLIPFIQGTVSRFDQEKIRLPFNITLGYPLDRTPMMQLVESLLTVLENADPQAIAAGDYLQLVRHPYVKISGDGGDQEPLKRGIHLLENIITQGNLTRVSMAGLEARLGAEVQKPGHGIGQGLAAEIKAQIGSLHRRFIPQAIDTMASLLAFLRRALEGVSSEKNLGAHLFLNEYAAATLAALEELEDFVAGHEGIFHAADASGMAAVVRSHLRGRTFRFEGSPLRGVQVMGPLEFRGLSFDDIVVFDAVEGILPGTAKYDPILPADIRAIFGIRDHSDWERIYAFNFFAMLGAAKHVHILFPRKSEDGPERARSRFIERIIYAAEKKTGRAPKPVPAAVPFAIEARELRRVRKDATVRSRLETVILSPSSLETYVQCPLQFYFGKVLGLKEREEVSPETDGSLIGTIAHEALHDLFKTYADAGAMSAAGEEAVDAELQRSVSKAFRRLNFDPGAGLERIRAWTLLERLRLFVREDRQRLTENGIQVETQEEKLSASIDVPGLIRPVGIAGRLDRRERQTGCRRVIDYKTGAPFSPRVRLEDDVNLQDLWLRDEKGYFGALAAFRKKYPGMQLLVYLLLLAGEKGNAWEELDAAYVFLQNGSGKMVQGIFRTGGRGAREFHAGERRAAMEAFSRDLGEIIRDIHAREYFLPDPSDERACGYCPFRLPCGNL